MAITAHDWYLSVWFLMVLLCVCGGRGLDLRKYILNPDNRDVNMYDLISVTNHYGGLGGGHCKWNLLIFHLGQCSGNTANRTPTGMHVYVGCVCVCVRACVHACVCFCVKGGTHKSARVYKSQGQNSAMGILWKLCVCVPACMHVCVCVWKERHKYQLEFTNHWDRIQRWAHCECECVCVKGGTHKSARVYKPLGTPGTELCNGYIVKVCVCLCVMMCVCDDRAVWHWQWLWGINLNSTVFIVQDRVQTVHCCRFVCQYWGDRKYGTV